jgi:polar amino acid transport system substrate-binding protein
MTAHPLSALFLCLAIGAPALASAGGPVVVTEDYPPFNFQKGEAGPVVGMSTDLLERAFHQAGLEFKVTLLPWARAYAMGLNDTNTCVYSTTRTEEREAKFKWVGPLLQNDWYIFGRADSPKLGSLADLKGATVGGYRGDAFTEFLKAQGIKVDEGGSDAPNPKKLQAKRIDYWAAAKLLGPYTAAREGVTGLVPLLKVKETELYLACNKSVDDATVAKLNEALKKLVAQGAAAEISKVYIQ